MQHRLCTRINPVIWLLAEAFQRCAALLTGHKLDCTLLQASMRAASDADLTLIVVNACCCCTAAGDVATEAARTLRMQHSRCSARARKLIMQTHELKLHCNRRKSPCHPSTIRKHRDGTLQRSDRCTSIPEHWKPPFALPLILV